MRKFVNAIVNVIRRDNRRNRVIGAAMTNVMAMGVDALRASGPSFGYGYQEHDCRDDHREHHHAPRPGHFGRERGRGRQFAPSAKLGLLAQFQLDQRSGLIASLAWRSLSSSTSKREASQLLAGKPFTATCTATMTRPQASGRCEQRVAITAARLLASA